VNPLQISDRISDVPAETRTLRLLNTTNINFAGKKLFKYEHNSYGRTYRDARVFILPDWKFVLLQMGLL
jgi:hypothetical protein